MAKSLLRLPEVRRRVGYGRAHLYSLIGQGHFPKPIRLGVRAVAWDSDEVDAWIAARITASRSAA